MYAGCVIIDWKEYKNKGAECERSKKSKKKERARGMGSEECVYIGWIGRICKIGVNPFNSCAICCNYLYLLKRV